MKGVNFIFALLSLQLLGVNFQSSVRNVAAGVEYKKFEFRSRLDLSKNLTNHIELIEVRFELIRIYLVEFNCDIKVLHFEKNTSIDTDDSSCMVFASSNEF